MIEAAMIWNEPNNKSHCDIAVDPDWAGFAEMASPPIDPVEYGDFCAAMLDRYGRRIGLGEAAA